MGCGQKIRSAHDSWRNKWIDSGFTQNYMRLDMGFATLHSNCLRIPFFRRRQARRLGTSRPHVRVDNTFLKNAPRGAEAGCKNWRRAARPRMATIIIRSISITISSIIITTSIIIINIIILLYYHIIILSFRSSPGMARNETMRRRAASRHAARGESYYDY